MTAASVRPVFSTDMAPCAEHPKSRELVRRQSGTPIENFDALITATALAAGAGKMPGIAS